MKQGANPHIPQVAPLPKVEGGFACILADPPWHFRAYAEPKTEEQMRKARSPGRHYSTMSVEEIAALPVKEIAARHSHLWLWITGPMLVRGVHNHIMASWGFRPSSSGLVWIKLRRSLGGEQHQLLTLPDVMRLLHTGNGFTTRKNAEFCLLGRRGSPKRLARDVHEVILSPVREHSRKPEESFERIERYCAGPRLEMFSRQQRDGWTVWGNQTDKFA